MVTQKESKIKEIGDIYEYFLFYFGLVYRVFANGPIDQSSIPS